MSKKLRIVLAQLNLKVGDIDGNLKKHIEAAEKARDELSADMIVFPELSLIGYAAEDLLLRSSFINDADKALQKFIAEIKNIYCVLGHPYSHHHHLYNASSIVHNGKILRTYKKQCLPNYGVFDEARYFIQGSHTCLLPILDVPIGFIICEDLWRLHPTRAVANQGAKLMIVSNASPFEVDKHEKRVALLHKRAVKNKMPILYVNQVGGQDELIFDGGSMACNAQGEICHFAGFFKENLLPVDIDCGESLKIDKQPITFSSSNEERIYQGLVLSLHDYVTKNNFPGVLLGLSGGIDSALTACLAVDALGKDRVHTLIMPSRFTTEMSLTDAKELIANLSIPSEIISIEPAYKALLSSLQKNFAGKKVDVTEENIQARVRAVILMALSNKSGYLLLTTGNRSELAVGYCTLYGDMAGGFALLKDIPKTLVYKLAAYRNQLKWVIPERTLNRAPTAELALDQKDEDTLPPYSLLDTILELYLNQGFSRQAIIDQGFDAALIDKVVHLIHRSEYKRKQSAMGPRINYQSFGKDWRYPITNGYKN